MSNYIVHKAVELSKVVKARQKELSQPGYLESMFIAQPKFDGCNTVLIKRNHDIMIYSRTGELVKSLDHVKAALVMLHGVEDGVYLGEAWAHDLTFPEISGRFRKQSTTEKTAQLQLVIFDYLTLDEWRLGESQLNYVERTARIPEILFRINQAKGAPVCVLRSFGQLTTVWPNATRQDIANKLVASGGYDGLILRDPDGKWIKGDNGTRGEIIKVKPLIRVTCRVETYIPGKGKHVGKIGTLVVRHNEKPQGAGTGLKDKERLVENFARDWEGKLVEIEALGYTEDGFLREPRLLGIRTDVVEPDA